MAKRKRSANQVKAGMTQPTMYREKKCIRITEADNGLTVSTYGPRGEQIMVARNTAEALRHTRTLMGEDKKK